MAYRGVELLNIKNDICVNLHLTPIPMGVECSYRASGTDERVGHEIHGDAVRKYD